MGDKLRYGIAGLVLLAALGLFLSAVWGLSSAYTRNQIQAEKASRDYTQSANRQISERCLLLAPAAMPECITVAIRASREDQRGERNLEAQQNTATWTGAMAILAGLGLLLSAGGVGLVYVTFQQAKRSADAAQKTYQAFVSVEDASLVIEFGTNSPIESIHEGKRQPDTYFLPIVVTNIGRSTARLDGWSMVRANGMERLTVDYSLKAGDTWDGLEHVILYEPARDFMITIHYSSPVRERMAMDVAAQLFFHTQANGVRVVSARVSRTSLRGDNANERTS